MGIVRRWYEKRRRCRASQRGMRARDEGEGGSEERERLIVLVLRSREVTVIEDENEDDPILDISEVVAHLT